VKLSLPRVSFKRSGSSFHANVEDNHRPALVAENLHTAR
jgi:hypothetical protein